MGTRLRNISSAFLFKVITVLLCIAGMLAIVFSLGHYNDLRSLNDEKDYLHSDELRFEINNVYDKVMELNTLRDVEYIKSGKTVTDDRIRDLKNSILEEKFNSLKDIKAQYDSLIDQAKENKDSEEAHLTKEKEDIIAHENEKYEIRLAGVKDEIIGEDLTRYDVITQEISRSAFYYTLVSDTEGKIIDKTDGKSDVEGFYKSLPYHIKSLPQGANNVVSSQYPNDNSVRYSSENSTVSYFSPKGITIYIGIGEPQFSEKKNNFDRAHNASMFYLGLLIAGLIIFILSFILFLLAAGRRKGTDEIVLTRLDHIFLDIGFIVFVIPIFFLVLMIGYITFTRIRNETNIYIFASTVIVATGVLLGLTYTSIFAKHFKRRTLIKNTIIYIVLKTIYKGYKEFVNKYGSAMLSGQTAFYVTSFFVAYNIVVAISFYIMYYSHRHYVPLFLFGMIIYFGINLITLFYIIKRILFLKVIAEGVGKVKEGELSWRIPSGPDAAMSNLSQNINNIANGISESVKNELKAERMKTELITNVSHDLKTPLTSIITYIDLLKKEGLHSENAPKYLEILDTKSIRLKTLTEDLFEAAKASSGNIDVSKEELDLASLVKQGFGELSDKVELSGLDFRCSFPEEKVIVNADGKLLWRVVDNLLSNVFKYALPSSRVYVSVNSENGYANVVIKNISAFPLNIPSDELMERFKRGDESRRSEGSGLGLAIAKSLTELQGGRLIVEIDGDLFKATVRLPLGR
ncbi:MAG: histidine kinase dimerization/phospho-acceptor domain-containing protein [Bacillota bacterium]|nr:histidine kinase dimerization/phospho-acceptor domain-containing protein [Bacillota bacterium]